ncbi:MAG: hypothetical protein F9K34_17775 [Albidovulum sp.]|uniref:hypothetical protein n=1 Tax=Albidovulum sp. TaxID=1872424 RepID=UPI00132BE856|nr:hypothetical protein [Defluviimonas sp.]KAB2878431.1 MAG: hypothetical protein F9K34_17775 [Defluviimonas sp.]
MSSVDGTFGRRDRFLWGCIGASCTWLLPAVKQAAQHQLSLPLDDPWFCLGILSWIAMGGAIATAFESANRIVAIFTGATWQYTLAAWTSAPLPLPGAN